MSERRAIAALVCAVALGAATPVRPAFALPDWAPALLNHWADRLLPSPAPVAYDGSNVPIPAVLNGGAPSYASAAYGNLGATASSGAASLALSLDGAAFSSTALPALGSNVDLAAMNVPFTAPAGVHTLGMRLDAANAEPESNENNNAYARQWFFAPNEGLSDGAVVRSEAPAPAGGQADIPSGTLAAPNADVVQVQPGPYSVVTGQWQVVAARGDAGGAQLALTLTDDDETPSTLARPSLVAADAPLDRTAFFVQNFNHLPGVNSLAFLRRSSGTGVSHFEARLSYPGELGMNATLPGNVLAADQMVAIHDLTITGADTGWVRIDLAQPAATARTLTVFVYDATTARANRISAPWTATTDRTGHAWLDVHVPVAGSYGVVIARDVVDGSPVACTYDLAVTPARPELAFFTPPGWAGPLTIALDSGLGTIPDHIDESAGCYIASLFNNPGHAPFPADHPAVRLFVDGQPMVETGGSRLDPGGPWALVVVSSSPWAGRHVIKTQLNPAGVPENNTGDDVEAAQFAWTPRTFGPLGLTHERAAPPLAAQDWDALPAAAGRWPNADGIRTPVFAPQTTGWWGAVAILPAVSTADLDLDIFGAAVGLTTGFELPLRTSSEAAGHPDLALIDVDSGLPSRAVCAGIRADGATSNYFIDCDGAASVPAGLTQPISGELRAGALFTVFDVAPGEAGPVRLVLDKLGPAGNLGVAVFMRDSRADGVYTLSGARAKGLVADQAAAAAAESLSFAMPSYYYAVVVYRTNANDVSSDALFRLHRADPGVLAVGDGANAPLALHLAAPSPNPVRGRGTIRFTLPAASPVDLALFDTAGRRVRTLVAGTQPPGEHAVAWDGADDGGSRLACGLYFVRLAAAGQLRTTKLTLVE